MTLPASPKEREQQAAPKRAALLRWLALYTFSHVDVLQALLGYGSRRGVELALAKMKRDKLVKSASIQVSYARPITLWGLTPAGLHQALEPQERLEGHSSFQPSRVAASTLEHALDIQLLHVRSLSAGWRNWRPAARFAEKLISQGMSVPDALAVLPTGEPVAIEVERTPKSVLRYQELLVSHLRGRKAGYWQRVVYAAPDEATASRIRRAFESIRTGSYQGETFQVQAGHLTPFTFTSYDQLFPPPAASLPA